jgi:radical SAM protein with 4Fe4S-binding SPASM domain
MSARARARSQTSKPTGRRSRRSVPEYDWREIRPSVVGWETTLACNMRCRHCGSTAGKERPGELDRAQARELCDQIIATGTRRAVLTGGETLLRKDWRAIVDRLMTAGLEVGLLSNGWVLTGRRLQELKRYVGPQFSLALSVDGTPAVHDEIRQLEGSFARIWKGAKELMHRAVWVDLITTINPANLDCLPALRDLVLYDLKPMAWQLQVTTPFGRARSAHDMTLSQLQYVRAACFVAETRRLAKETTTSVHTGDCLGYLSRIESSLRDQPWSGCGAGTAAVGIRSNGDVIGCLSIIDDRYVEGNALTDGLAAIWQRPGAFAYNRRFAKTSLRGDCASCDQGLICRGGCTASSVAVFGQANQAPYCLLRVDQLCDQKPAAREARRNTTTA